MSKFLKLTAALICLAGTAGADTLGLGRPALPEEIAAWDLDVLPDGTGLPEGSGSVEDGEALFADYCAICHGDFAEGVDNWPKLAGGDGTLADKDPLKTVGSYWPYLSTTWDYVHRSMPFGNAQTLSDDEVYAIVAYILYSNYIVEEDFVLSRDNFLEVEMPNADGFIIDDRAETEYPRFAGEPCMTGCKDAVEITMRAAVLDVTPEETKAKKVQQLVDATNPRNPTKAAADPAPAAEAEPAAEAAAEAAPAAAEAPAAPAAPDPALVAEGEKLFRKCKACHQVGDKAKNRSGPILNGVVDRAAATVDGFKYSKGMVAAAEDGLTWDDATLRAFLTKPKDVVKGTKMSFAGFKKDAELDAIIAYLSTFHD